MKRLIAIQQALRVAKSKDGYGYKYRDAEQILEAAKPALSEQQCAIICEAEYVELGGALFKKVTARLMDENGKEIASASDMVKSPSEMKGMVSQQVSGSDTTYCKRYALQNLLAIDNGEDDVDCKTNPLNPKNQNKQPMQKQQPKKPAPQAPAPAAEKPKSVSFDDKLNAAQSAIELQALESKLNDYLQAGKMDRNKYDAYMQKLIARGAALNCTHTDVEGWIDNKDLFGDE